VTDGEIAVASKEEMQAAPLSGKRLLALCNALPGASAVGGVLAKLAGEKSAGPAGTSKKHRLCYASGGQQRPVLAGLYGRGQRQHSTCGSPCDARHFASVNATYFDVTWTNSSGDPRRYDEGVGLAELSRTIRTDLDRAARHRRNVIVRPRGLGVTFLQLDDLRADQLPPSPWPCFSFSKPRLAIFKPGSHCRAPKTKNLRAACEGHGRRCNC
jgi:hypothetical protein